MRVIARLHGVRPRPLDLKNVYTVPLLLYRLLPTLRYHRKPQIICDYESSDDAGDEMKSPPPRPPPQQVFLSFSPSLGVSLCGPPHGLMLQGASEDCSRALFSPLSLSLCCMGTAGHILIVACFRELGTGGRWGLSILWISPKSR